MERQYQFIKDLFATQGMSTVFNTRKFEQLSQVDRGFRRYLQVENVEVEFQQVLEDFEKETLIFYTDEFGLHYLFFWDSEDTLISVGPYKIENLISTASQLETRQDSFVRMEEGHILQYYSSLPSFPTGNALIEQMKTILKFVYQVENIPLHILNYKTRTFPIVGEQHEVTIQSLAAVEERYRAEDEFLLAVEHGDTQAILTWNWDKFIIEDRHYQTMENVHDSMIILNTLCRKAVQRSGVHPFYIHELSSHFHQEINQMIQKEDSVKIMQEMMVRYSTLVQQHAIKGYSAIVERAMREIEFHLADCHSLSDVSKAIAVNSSYLSARFKKEVGQTVTDYVHSKRMERAAYYLSVTNDSIPMIAELLGYQDDSYFYKRFKKFHHVTPSEYRKQANKN